jgi:hypothetical protein
VEVFLARLGSFKSTSFHAALVCISLLQVIAVIGQGALAGSFLSGDDSSVALHEIGGWIAFGLALIQLGLLIAKSGRAYGLWLLMSSIGIVLAEALQLGSGYGRFFRVHIPLALIIIGGLTWQIIWIAKHPGAVIRSADEAS